MVKMTLRQRYTMWRMVRMIEWIGKHVLGNGDQLTVWRESDSIMHAVLGRRDEECQ